MALTLTSKSLNRYEQYHDLIKNSKFYSDENWDIMARTGRLDEYIDVITKANSQIKNYDALSDYKFDWSDNDTRYAAIANEVLADRTNVDEERERYVMNPDGSYQVDSQGQPLVEKFTASDYDYYKSVIRERNEINFQNYLQQQEQERKKSISGFWKYIGTELSLGTEALYGLTNQVDDITSSIAAIGSAVNSIFTGEKASDAMVKANADDTWRFFERLGVQDWIVDFEKRYTWMRKVNGDYSGFGEIAGGVARTLGQMLPSFLVGKGVGKGLVAAGASVETASTVASYASSLIFYQGVTSGAVRDMYKQMSAKGASVSTASILANATIKSALQYAVELGLKGILGGTNLDQLVFGRPVSPKVGGTLTKAAEKRLLSDFVEEGLEEVFQDTSDFLVDRAFSKLINENFGSITELTWQSLMDSFIVGGLTSIAGSAMDIIKTKKVRTSNVKLDKDGNVVTDKDGNVVYEELGYLASWEYGLDMESFVRNFASIQTAANDLTNKDSKKYAAAFTEMYASYRMLSSVYSSIGEERFASANKLLKEITRMIDNGKFDIESEKTYSAEMANSLILLKKEGEEYSKEVLDKLKKAEMTKIVEVVEKGTENKKVSDILDKAKSKVKTLIDELFEKDDKIKTAVITEDGNNVVQSEDTVFIPLKMALNSDGKMIFETVAEQTLVENVLKGNFKGIKISEITDIYKKVYGDENATDELAAYNLLFNSSFFRIVLSTADRDTFNFLTSLYDIEKSIIPKKLRDETYKNKINTVIKNMKSSVMDYLINQHNANINLDFLDEKEQKYISAMRWYSNLYDRVIDSNTFSFLTSEDWKVLENRVNAAPINDAEKKTILSNLHSAYADVRTSAMNRLSELYNNAFQGKYNGKIYMPETSIPNRTFNAYMQERDLTIENLLSMNVNDAIKKDITTRYREFSEQTLLRYRQNEFTRYSGNQYIFLYDNKGKIGVYEESTKKQVGYSEYNAQMSTLLSGSEMQSRSAIEKANKQNHLVKALLNSSVDAVTAATLSIDDVIMNPNLLSEQIKADIRLKYTPDQITSQNTFLYLREYFIKKLKNTTVIILPDGTYAFGSVRPMLSSLKQGTTKIKLNYATKIEDIIDKKYLYGRLADIKIVLTDKDILAEYSSGKNIIFINKRLAATQSELLTFAFLHEFQHAIQLENGMNIGMNSKWIKTAKLSEQVKKSIITDVRKHRPELFKNIKKGTEQEMQIVNDFVYASSGESTAFGADATTLVDFYPTIVKFDYDKGTTIQFPWGTSYKIGNIKPLSLQIKTFANDMVTLLDEEYLKKFRDAEILTWERYEAGLVENKEYAEFKQNIHSLNKVYEYILAAIGEAPISRELKRDAKQQIAPVRDYTLDFMRRNLGFSNMSMEEFLELPLPVIRIQDNNYIYDDEFISFSCCLPGRNLHSTIMNYLEQKRDTNRSSPIYNLFYGFIKPKDMFAYVGTMLNEVWLNTTNEVKNFKSVEISMISSNLTMLSESEKTSTVLKPYYSRDDELFKTLSDHILTNYPENAYELAEGSLVLTESLFKKLHMLDSAIDTIQRDSFITNDLFFPHQISEEEGDLVYAYIPNRILRIAEDIPTFENSDYNKVAKSTFVEICKVNNIDVSNNKKFLTISYELRNGYNVGYIVFTRDDLMTAIAMQDDKRLYRYDYVSLSDISCIIPGSISTFATKSSLLMNDNTSSFYSRINDYETVDIYDSNGELVQTKDLLGELDEQSLRKLDNKSAEELLLQKITDKAKSIIKQNTKISLEDAVKELRKNYPFVPEKQLLQAVNNAKGDTRVQLDTLQKEVVKPKSKSYIAPEYKEEFIKMTVEKAHAEAAKKKKEKRQFTKQSKYTGTNLEKYGYVGPYKRRLLASNLISFIVNADETIDEKLWSKLTAGTLKTKDVMSYLRTAETIDDKTFKLINDSYFQNKHITSFEELTNFVENKTAEYYAMRAILKKLGYTDLLLENTDTEFLDKFIEIISKDESLYNLYTGIVDRYDVYGQGTSKERTLNISKGNLRRLWLQYFDGSAYRAGHLAAIAKAGAIAGWKIPDDVNSASNVRLDKEVADGLTLEEVLEDPNAQAAFDELILSRDRKEKIDDIMEFMSPKIAKKILSAGGNKSVLAKYLASKRQQLEDMSDKEFDKQYKTILGQMPAETINSMFSMFLVSEAAGLNIDKMSDKEINKLEQVSDKVTSQSTRPSNAIVSNIRSIARTIRLNLNSKDKTRFLSENNDIFTDDLKIKDEVIKEKVKDKDKYTYIDAEKLLPIEERVRQLSKDVRAGTYKSKKAMDYKKQLDKQIKKLQTDKAKLVQKLVNEKTTKTVSYEISDETITINTDKPIPKALERILATEFKKTAKSKTKYITEDDEVHIRTRLKDFVSQNAELLNVITQQDVDEIIDFYSTSEILPATNKARTYSSVQVYMMTFLLKQAKSGKFTLTEEQYNTLNNRLKTIVSVSAENLANWKSAMDWLKPEEIIVQSLGKQAGLEFSTDDVVNLVNSVKTGNPNAIQAAKQRMYNNARDNYKRTKKSFLDQVLKFEKLAMLSGPGTWIRNKTSNIVVKYGNIAAEKVGKSTSELIERLFPKKEWKRKNQYKLVGTEVTADVQAFVKYNFVENGLIDMIGTSGSKYDSRGQRSADFESEQNLAKLISESIKTKIFNDDGFNVEAFNKVQRVILKLLSDDKYIKKAALKYFGKMLTEDREKIDLYSGITNPVIDRFAEAYKLAAFDYMRKTNFIHKLETQIKYEFGDTAFFMYKQVFPFLASSWNWFLEGMNYTPVGLAKAIIDYAKLENTIEKLDKKRQQGENIVSSRFAEYLVKRNIGKGVIGSIGALIGALLALLGIGKLDTKDNRYKLTIKLGKDSVAVDFSDVLGTQGIMLGMGAVAALREKNWQAALETAFDAMFDDSMFSESFNTFRDWSTELPFSFLNMFVPNFFSTLSRTISKYPTKYSTGFLKQVELLTINLIPGIAYAFPKKVDIYSGENQVIYKAWLITNLVNKLSPMKIYPYNVSDIEKEALSLGVSKTELRGNYTINGESVSVKSKDVQKLNEFYGKLNKKYLEELFDNKKSYRVFDDKQNKYVEIKYNKMTDEQKKTVIERIMNDNSQISKIYILTSSGEWKYYATDEEYKKLKSLGLTNIYKTTKSQGEFKKI